MDKYINKLSLILDENNVCKSHGIDHAINVFNNATLALSEYNISDNIKKNILLAYLLHDADDYKFFKHQPKYTNLLKIMIDDNEEDINMVIEMIELVSSSKNGDNIPKEYLMKYGDTWFLIPRYADRLEAIGYTGLIRAITYSKTLKSEPLYVKETIIPESEEHIYEIASLERYNNYNGISKSLIDHFYDKLVRISFFPIRNNYFDNECNKKRKPIIDFLLYFGKCIKEKNSFTYDDINIFMSKLYYQYSFSFPQSFTALNTIDDNSGG